jgi:hypothetical protein
MVGMSSPCFAGDMPMLAEAGRESMQPPIHLRTGRLQRDATIASSNREPVSGRSRATSIASGRGRSQRARNEGTRRGRGSLGVDERFLEICVATLHAFGQQSDPSVRDGAR